MKRHVVCSIALACATLLPSRALADTLTATLSEPISEVSHGVTLTVADGIGRFVVRRTFANLGERHDEAFMSITLPAGAAATGLRIRVGERWYDGELLEAERAAELYQELTGLGPHTPRDPALLSWEWADQLNLRLFPVLPGGTATVEYTLTLPTEYRAGRYLVTYPLADPHSELVAPVLTVADWSHGAVSVDGRPVATAQPVVLAARPHDPRCDDIGLPQPCAVSDLEVPAAVAPGRARLVLGVRHTFRSDLRIVLTSPGGAVTNLWANEGGAENDVRIERDIEVAAEPAGVWRLGIIDEAGLDVGVLEHWSLTFADRGVQANAEAPVFIPDYGADGGVAAIELRVAPTARPLARLGRVGLKGAAASRFELDLPAQLSPMPVAPHVVFVVDLSRSVGERGLDEQRRLIEGFLAHVPDARFDVVGYSRFAQRIAGEFRSASEFATWWEEVAKAGSWDLSNGSNADQALALAYEVLADVKGPRYVIAFTDDRLRPAWPEDLRFGVSATDELTTHVLLVDGGGEWARDDDHRLSALALRDGGILTHVGYLDALDPKQFAAATLHLVRPTRLDDVTVNGFDEVPQVLEEGASVREMGLFAAPTEVTVRAKLWARSYTVSARSTRAFDRATAAWVFSHDLHNELTPEQMMAFAMFGRAVSPVTSYLAIEPGVRPSPVGIDRFGSGGLGASGFGRGGGGVLLRTGVPLPSLRSLLGHVAQQCRSEHGAGSATLALHTTFVELVDVELQSAVTPYAQCVVEGAWALRLPDAFYQQSAVAEVVTL